MDYVLAGRKWRTCIVYLDDVLVFPDNFDSHLRGKQYFSAFVSITSS